MADAVRCEACNWHADRPFDPAPFPGMLLKVPDGWVRIIVVDPSEVRAEVCGWECAADWMAVMRDSALLAAEVEKAGH